MAAKAGDHLFEPFNFLFDALDRSSLVNIHYADFLAELI